MIPRGYRTWEPMPLIYGHREHRPPAWYEEVAWVPAGGPGSERYEVARVVSMDAGVPFVVIAALWLGAAALLASSGKKG